MSKRSQSQSSPLMILPFTILIDHREGAPYTFQNIPPAKKDEGKIVLVETFTQHLPTGDYALFGEVDVVCVERKSLQDLYGTLGGGRERFENELERLRKVPFANIVVEATIGSIMNPASVVPGWTSNMNPRSVYESIMAWKQRYRNIHWSFCDNRRIAEIETFTIFSRYVRELEKAGRTTMRRSETPVMELSPPVRQ